jgi:hypothetical protein
MRILAKRAGITAVIGFGASPGLSNLLVKHAAAKMDQADEAQIPFVDELRKAGFVFEETETSKRVLSSG